MKLKLQNGLGAEISLFNFYENAPENLFLMEVSEFVRRTGIQERFGKDGGVSMGDGRAKPRKITLKYNNRTQQNGTKSERDKAYRNKLNQITAFFDPILAPWYLIDLDNDIRCEIVMEQNSDVPNGEGLSLRLGSNDLQFTMLDGHWEDLEEVGYSQSGILSNGNSFQILNDSLFYTWIRFELTAVNNNTEFTINNLTTEESMTISNVGNTVGKIMIVDGINGSILLDGVESSNSMADGSGFISLAPGLNQFSFESIVSGQMFLEAYFRRRYAH